MSLIFYYDVVCPFAYMASRLVDAVGRRAGVNVVWRPVLLGGLYELTGAPQGREGSAMDVAAPNKLKLLSEDLYRQWYRRGVPNREPCHHPQRTVYAMRLLSGIPDNSLRVSLSHDLYRAYWCESRDVSDMEVLQEIAAPHGVNATELVKSEEASQVLRSNTKEAADRGAFGVPSFYVNDRLYFGTDRLFFVEQQLNLPLLTLERLAEPPPTPSAASLTFFFDYSSPWSFLGFMRLPEVLRSVQPVQVKVEWVPILLGALFKQIGTPVVPLQAASPVKAQYNQCDLTDWCEYAGVKLVWPNAFPIRTVLPLRLTIASRCDPQIVSALYRAAWQENKDIGNPEVVREVLTTAGVEETEQLMRMAESDPVKKQLFANTTRAVEEGLCGVPSFRVNNGPVIWGQDRLNVVADMLCGWQDKSTAKL